MASNSVSFLTSKTGWSSSLNKALADAIFSRSKITAKQSEIEVDVKTIMDVVNQVNACDFDTRRLGSERLEDVALPVWAADFVMPRKMTLTSNQWATDLLVRPELQADFIYDETAVRNAAHRLAKTQKLEPSFESAMQMRGSVMVFSDAKIQVKGRTKQDSEAVFVPLPVNPKLDEFLGDWSNADANAVLAKWITVNFSLEKKASPGETQEE